MLIHTINILEKEALIIGILRQKTTNKTSSSSRVFNISSTIRVRFVFSCIEIEEFLRHVRNIDWFHSFICETCLDVRNTFKPR